MDESRKARELRFRFRFDIEIGFRSVYLLRIIILLEISPYITHPQAHVTLQLLW